MVQTRMPAKPRLRVGMIDPRLNETVTHVAEMDMEAAQEDIRRLRRGLYPLLVILIPFSICLPCLWICMCTLYNAQKKHILTTVENTQVYLTDNTIVFISPHLPIERGRTMVPLANIATVVSQGHVLTVIIKATAPEVIMNSTLPSGQGLYSSYATRSIPVECIKNASDFADVIRARIK